MSIKAGGTEESLREQQLRTLGLTGKDGKREVDQVPGGRCRESEDGLNNKKRERKGHRIKERRKEVREIGE